jgi:hypothetical protein
MPYQRKTRDFWTIQGHYGPSGWEVVTVEDTLQDAKQMLKDYRANSTYPHRTVKHRVRLDKVDAWLESI